MNFRYAKFVAVVVGVLAVVSAAIAQPPPKVTWSAEVRPSDIRPGESGQLVLTAKIIDGWHIYGLGRKHENVITPTFTLPDDSLLDIVGEPVEPEGLIKFDKTINSEVIWHSGEVAFGIPIRLGESNGAEIVGTIDVRSQACDERSCDQPRVDTVEYKFTPGQGPVRPDRVDVDISVPEQPAGYIKPENPSSSGGSGETKPPTDGQPTDATLTQINEALEAGLLPFVLLSFTFGLLALVTPCVWPMIPITVSFFSKRTGEGKESNLRGALAYCLGIMGTFVGLGLLVSALFGAAGLQKFAANPWINLVLAVVFIVLALNLFGVFEIGVPQKWINKAQSGTKKQGLVGPLLLGLTFSLTSFTCTVPFVGSLLVMGARGSYLYPAIGMVAFSAAFALPFFMLAMFPQFLAKLPKSGVWLANVKAYMGFLEIAAALKFLSNMDLTIGAGGTGLGLLTRESFLAVWAAIFILAALFLFGWIRLATEADDQKIGWGRRIFAAGNVAIAVWCLAALQGSASMGKLAGFLPPDPYPGREARGGAITWIHTYDEGMSVANAEQKLVFVNFTGINCTNCRVMEQDVFPRPEVRAELEKFVRIELYTDRERPDDRANAKLREELTQSATNPVYVVMTPAGDVVSVFQGMEISDGEFLNFLSKARDQAGALTTASRATGQ